MAEWIDRELFEEATPITEQREYCVASGASRKIVLSNLAYLNFMFNFYSNSPGYDGPMGMPTDVFLGVKMTVLWFASMSVSTANICELFNVQQGAPVGDRFFRFLTSVHHSSSHSLSVMPPLVIDVCIQRDMTPTRQTMQQLYSEGGRSRAYEMFVAPLPPTENEKWAHMTKTGELTNTTEQQADFEEHVKDFANISAKRFAACCDCTTELHLAFTYANAVLHPCVALHHLARPDLALLFCQVIALASCTTPFHRGLIALTTLSQRMFDLLEVVGGEGRTIPNSVKKSILYFLRERQPHTTLVQGWPIDGGEAPQGGPSSAEELSTVITPLITDLTVLSANLGRLSSRATRSAEDLGEVCAPEVVQQVSVFSRPPTTTLDLDSLVGSGSAAFDDGNDDSVVAHLNTEFAQKQISGRSINVSLILRLQWESASFYLTLYVTPGGVCYMVEREGNLEMSSDVRNCRVVNVFKSHGDAWNYCKARYGPVSLAGEGFFLYRSKANSGGWRFFLGNSVELRPTLSSPLPGDSPSEPRFYVWHIAAYHSVLCLRLDSALKEMLHIICKHVFLTAFAQDEETQSLTDDERMTRVLTSLVCSRGDQFDKARSVALPLLAYCRLLLLAANAMRRSGHNDTNRHSSTQQWSFSLVEFQAQFKTALAPQRVGTVYDAEIDALSLINGLTVIYPPKTFFPEGSEKADTSEKADPAFCFPRDVQSMALNKELEGHIDILPTLKKPDSKEILFSALSDPVLRTGILDCVRRLSSSTDIKFVQAVLSENRHSSERLHHFELAFCPLPVSHVWNMLGNWIKYSVNGIAELEAKRRSTMNSSTAPQRETSIANAIHETHMNELRKSRQSFFGEAQKIRNYLRDPPVGEGVGRRLSNEVEHCWTHASTHQIPSFSNTDESATLAERPSPHIIWRDYEPDGFSVDRGEHVAFILDTLFCYRNPHDEGTPPLLVTGAMRFTSFESEELFFEVTQEKVESAQADDVTFLAHIPTIAEQQRLTIRRDAACVRLQRSDGLMLSCTRRFGCDGGNDSHAWEFCKPSKNSDEQFFTLSMVSAPKSAAVRKAASRLEDQFRAQMFRWVVTIIGSPMSVQWKLFFVHHMHVHSRKQAPTNASSLIAYCIANLCPAQRLRDQLLGALNFSPTRFCRRRDRHFGVVVTSHIPDLQSSEWSQLDKVGPITLSAAPEAEQYRELTKKFSFATTHVIVVGMSTVKDQLLKWCCELTKRYPWRFILFVQCDIRSNAPENRDRIVDLSETIFDKPDICRVSFDPMVREKYISRQQESSTIHSIVSNRVRDWPIKLLQFLKRPKTPIRQSQISEATHQARRQPQQRVVLIVSPPGGGKSMELRNLEFDLSTNNNEGSTFRIINFDCSGDALVHRALWTLLNDAVAGIELGGDSVVLVVDEYHMLSRAKKIEFIRWAESRIGDIKIVLLANRDDPDDEALDERLNNVSGQSTISIIQRARISICKMVEALSTVRMTAPASIHRAVTFLCATRLLISDDAISLRMTPDFNAAPYASESGRPPTPLEASVRAKLHAENYVFVSMMMRRFDTIYDGLPSAAARSDVVRAFNIMFSSRGSLQHQKSNDPISVLVFTAMLPTLLLWGESSKSVANISPVDSDDHSTHDDNDCEALPTFVEFVGSTSAYNVHPAVRFGSWVHYILTELNHHRALTMPESSSTAVGTATNHALQLHVPSINDLIKLMATLETLDHPAFFPLIFKTIDAPADLNFCDTVIQTHPNSFESLYDAVVRHEAVDWNAIRIQWVHEPLTVDELLKLANPSVIAPETVLRQLAANTLFGLLHREQGRAHGQLHSSANATSARTISDQPQTDWSGSAAALRNLVLTYYPKDLIAREGDTRASPYFWSVWQATVLLPLDEALWIECVTKYIPFDDTASDHPSAFAGTGTRGRFVMWASAYGQSSGVFDDADVRTTVCIRILAQLAKGYLTEEQWAHFARENFVAPALCLRTSSGSEVLDIDFAFKIATAPLPPHPLWSHDMTLLARLRNRDTLLSGNESAKLFVSMGSSISPTTPPRVIGAMLQSSPSGMLPVALQNALLSAPIEVTDNDLCSEVTDDVIYRNVAEGLSKRKMQTNGRRTNEANDEIHLTGSRVQSILQAFIVNVAVSPAVEREESEGAFHTPRTNLTPIEANNEVEGEEEKEEEQEVEEEREEGGEAQQDNVDAEENEEGNIV
ncbi:Hypothetical protein, putative [Bodo saltans]|uniref:AAA+ ATPase domain-containing protein n=1 Tax=Bodo saltans TaxID=75058 RepID=A0A0S4KLU7_BODSA|nr:Hypothetical protein, putative [Bodo saltans]|eukprot:CUI11143.1 Hypothetical protein, putative [Bodo saltans]